MDEEEDEDMDEEEADDEEEEATTGELPGEGISVAMGRATWDTGWFQAAIYQTLMQEMGYEVDEVSTLDNPAFYLSAARGDLDFWANGWFPLHNTFLQDENVEGEVEPVGFQVEAGALQGYLIDKATADEMGITSLEDFKDPEIASAFDSDDDGLANLIGCNPGWGCEAVIEHHLDAYELRDSIQHVQGEYSALMADTIARYQRGEPILFYTWTPNWTVAELAPGEDVVWIEVPFSSLPEDQADMEDMTTGEGIPGCVSDPCNMGFPPNDIRVAANVEFLEENPAAERLFKLVEIPLADIAEQNQLMVDEGEDSDEDIARHAEEWIEENSDQIDEWLELAMDLEAPLPTDDEEAMEEEGEAEEAMDEEAMEEEGEAEEAMDEEGEAEEAAPEEGAAMPGEGTSVAMGRATWDTGWFQAAIYQTMLQDLGYEVDEVSTLDNPAFYLSAARGDLDFWANGWFPLHNTFLQDENVEGEVEPIGFQVENGALQGYLIDKATADEMGITNLEDFKDPEIASAFDSDGDGLANMIGCNPGWGCEAVIEHHLDAYELRDSIQHVQGEYSALMADTIARFQRGEPILFYTWTPNWTVAQLTPGEDVVWIEVPFSSLPEDQADMEDMTTGEGIPGCVSDPCNIGFPPNDIRVVANVEFLEQNPAAERLFELVEIPLDDIAAQNQLMVDEGEDSDEDIARHAEEWLDENSDQVSSWLEEARTAAE
jgi:glycine betaine/proline transport system substrate-binding protein